MAEFVTINKYFSLQEAHLAKNALESAGIDAVILNSLSAQVYNFHVPTDGGIVLKVRSDQFEEARNFLQDTPADLEIDESFVETTEDYAETATLSKQASGLGNVFLLILGLIISIWFMYLFLYQLN